eukprot:maker-scaffold_20-snap-gene-3.43-mRNA-1 protein AED:0.00 eAED:0.00 QI:151/1/1/1/1/1/2/75/326
MSHGNHRARNQGNAHKNANFDGEEGFFGRKLDHEAPIVVCDCMAFIRNKGLYTTGVFRIPGGKGVVDELKARYNAYYKNKDKKRYDSHSVLNEFKDEHGLQVHDVASLLKAFFNDLETPFISRRSIDEMVNAIQKYRDEPTMLIDSVNRIIRAIPSPNRECFGLLISFLREVSAFRKFNQMNAENLATCFVLSLIGADNATDQLQILGTGGIAMKTLITKDVKLYMPSMQNVKNNTKFKGTGQPVPAAESNPGGTSTQGSSRGNPVGKDTRERSNDYAHILTSEQHQAIQGRKKKKKKKQKQQQAEAFPSFNNKQETGFEEGFPDV